MRGKISDAKVHSSNKSATSSAGQDNTVGVGTVLHCVHPAIITLVEVEQSTMVNTDTETENDSMSPCLFPPSLPYFTPLASWFAWLLCFVYFSTSPRKAEDWTHSTGSVCTHGPLAPARPWQPPSPPHPRPCPQTLCSTGVPAVRSPIPRTAAPICTPRLDFWV